MIVTRNSKVLQQINRNLPESRLLGAKRVQANKQNEVVDSSLLFKTPESRKSTRPARQCRRSVALARSKQRFDSSYDRTARRINAMCRKVFRLKVAYPVTPDGRYFLVKGRLWRCTNPNLPPDLRQALVGRLMHARRAKGMAMRKNDRPAREEARLEIDRVKRLLGERGPAWWSDGAPDWNRHTTAGTPYAEWAAALGSQL